MTQSHAHKAARSSGWTVGGQMAAVTLRLTTSAVLWRLLDADDFGLMALVFVVLQGIHMFSDVGIGPALVQSKHGQDSRYRNTAWTLQVFRGVLLSAICCALAWPMSRMYDTRLLEILPLAGLTALITGFCSTAVHSMNRDLLVGRVVVNEVAAQLVGAAVGVVWAVLWPSVWALVGGSLAASIVTTVLSYQLPSSGQRLCIDPSYLREQLVFGRWITLSSACMFLASGTDRLILGRLVPTAVLGVYSNALNVSQMPGQLLQALGARVLFPVLALKHREGNLSQTFARAKSMLVTAAGTAAAGLIVTGPELVPLVFGVKATEGGWMVQVLAAGMWLQSLEAINSKVMFARGETKWIAGATLARFVVIAAALPASYYFAGVPGALSCIALSDLPRYAVSAIGATRAGVPVLRDDVSATAGLAAATAAGLAAAWSLAPTIGAWGALAGALLACGIWTAVRIRAILAAMRFVTDHWRPRSVPA